jgi:hypothetical protein
LLPSSCSHRPDWLESASACCAVPEEGS